MFKRALLILSLVTLAALPVQATDNAVSALIKNVSFERWTSGVPNNWQIKKSQNPNLNIVQTNDHFGSGNYALEASASAQMATELTSNHFAIPYNPTMKPDATYVLSIAARPAKVGKSAQAIVTLRNYATGELLCRLPVTVTADLLTWAGFERSCQIPQAKNGVLAYVSILMRPPGDGQQITAIHLDNVNLVQYNGK